MAPKASQVLHRAPSSRGAIFAGGTSCVVAGASRVSIGASGKLSSRGMISTSAPASCATGAFTATSTVCARVGSKNRCMPMDNILPAGAKVASGSAVWALAIHAEGSTDPKPTRTGAARMAAAGSSMASAGFVSTFELIFSKFGAVMASSCPNSCAMAFSSRPCMRAKACKLVASGTGAAGMISRMEGLTSTSRKDTIAGAPPPFDCPGLALGICPPGICTPAKTSANPSLASDSSGLRAGKVAAASVSSVGSAGVKSILVIAKAIWVVSNAPAVASPVSVTRSMPDKTCRFWGDGVPTPKLAQPLLIRRRNQF